MASIITNFQSLQKRLQNAGLLPQGTGDGLKYSEAELTSWLREPLLQPLENSQGWEEIFTLLSRANDTLTGLQISSFYQNYFERQNQQVAYTDKLTYLYPGHGSLNLSYSNEAGSYKESLSYRCSDGSSIQFQYAAKTLQYSYSLNITDAYMSGVNRGSFTVEDLHHMFPRYRAQRMRRRELGLCERCGLPLRRRNKKEADALAVHPQCHVYNANVDYRGLGNIPVNL